jgi:hypothetical protein
MFDRVKKCHPALRHGGFATTTILPGESAAEFEKQHRKLIAELTPNGALEEDIVATMARLLWRKQNLATFRIAELARRRCEQIKYQMVPQDILITWEFPRLCRGGSRSLTYTAVVRRRSS